MLAVYKRELQGYFFSPIAYIFIAIFTALAGVVFTGSNTMQYSANYNAMLYNLTFLFFIVVPVLTMRLLSEERKNKTDQLLLTAPVSLTSMVLGKYFAALTVFLITLVITLMYPIILAMFGNPSVSEIFTGYVGFFLLGAALIAFGVFVSALAENQVTSAIITFGVLFLLYISSAVLIDLIPVQWIKNVLSWFDVYSKFESFSTGLLSITQIVYYISFSAVFIFLTVRKIESRRWSEV